MTSDKKNIKDLVTNADDDPTAELEIINRNDVAIEAKDELEANANTYDCDEPDTGPDRGNDIVARLKKEVRLRDESIDRMQFDIEQLRARWNGLDKEIQVRDKLTDDLVAELQSTKNALSLTGQSLSARTVEIESLESLLREQQKLVVDAETKAKSSDERIEVLEQQAKQYEKTMSRLEELEIYFNDAELRREAAQSNHEIEELTEQLADRDSRVAKLSTELDDLHQQLNDTQASLVQVKHDDPATALGASDNAHELVADTTPAGTAAVGLLADNRQEVRELQSQLQRTEAYADTLRNRYQDQTKAAETLENALVQTEAELANANAQVVEHSRLLEAAHLENLRLQEQVVDLTRQFEDEVRKIRFELGTAQQTITDHETVNEQLTSDLIDNQSFRQALESKLEHAEETSETQIRELRQKLKRLERQHSEDSHKISNKDNAIAALLNELASRSSIVENVNDAVESRISSMESPAIEKHDDRLIGDRITRLLVGEIDGQELRFPLFKDRLTIGRTTQNDIHLKAQYISRRHALIVTENERTRIVDWGSKNGISVNRTKVTEQVLKSGDVVTIGTADFRYEERPKR